MSETKELTFEEISSHNSKKDLYLVIHDKVYDATQFIDEHPGGEEVLLDVGGQDATEAFEDVGHSDEARSILEGLKTADLKRKPGEAPAPEVSATSTSTSTSTQPTSSANDAGMGIVFYALVLLGGGLAFGAYKYLQAKSSGEAGK